MVFNKFVSYTYYSKFNLVSEWIIESPKVRHSYMLVTIVAVLVKLGCRKAYTWIRVLNSTWPMWFPLKYPNGANRFVELTFSPLILTDRLTENPSLIYWNLSRIILSNTYIQSLMALRDICFRTTIICLMIIERIARLIKREIIKTFKQIIPSETSKRIGHYLIQISP